MSHFDVHKKFLKVQLVEGCLYFLYPYKHFSELKNHNTNILQKFESFSMQKQISFYEIYLSAKKAML